MKMKRGEQNDAHEFFIAFISSITKKMDQKSALIMMNFTHHFNILGGEKLWNQFSTLNMRLNVLISLYTPSQSGHFSCP